MFSYSSMARVQNYLRDYKSAITSEKLVNKVYTEVLGADNVNTLRSSQALRDYTSNAVSSAREVALEKSPEYRELKLRYQETLKREQAKLEAQAAAANRGHLPVEELVKFIDGKESKSSKAKRNKKRSSPK